MQGATSCLSFSLLPPLEFFQNLQISVPPAELVSFLDPFWAGVDGCVQEAAIQAEVMERQSSNPGGAKENFFCCFWISSPRVSLCFSARAALKCLTVHFSMLIERSLLPTARHFFHPAHKPSSAMQLPQSALPLCSLGAGPRGWESEGISAKCILVQI